MVYCLLNRFLILYLRLSTSLFFSLLRIIKGYASFGRRRYVEKILRETGKSGLDGQEHTPRTPDDCLQETDHPRQLEEVVVGPDVEFPHLLRCDIGNDILLDIVDIR